MKYKSHIYLLTVLLIASCNNDKKIVPDNLRKLSEKEQIEIAEKRMNYNYDTVVYKNEAGETITADSIAKISTDENFASDVYLNKSNEPEIIIIRRATEHDKDFISQIAAIYNQEVVEPVLIIDIDCAQIKEILIEVYSLDQNMRMDGSPFDPSIDRENLVKVISLIENCGMPTLENVNKKELLAIWLVFQHADNYHRKKYLPQLKKSAENGDLRKSEMALMEDRILMDDRKPQIYGSQITDNEERNGWMLYDLENPESVDRRRADVGLEPLNEYVKQWDIEFDIKQNKLN
ncbi:hypothetical protein F0365_13650 [Nonlabens sp. Ci31]|uniref:DUF6624 domain-containing protein n=1 Tax=Nonlabens sp. Ci31 TaxID=2608253 RepID=UPI001462F5D8|nr:DUF6624 domain-containing protein [Nonlabens sp. Ci31]QJP35369.1 hypothetical protein F0365_13650 [Nonlabens sp. Ci31]